MEYSPNFGELGHQLHWQRVFAAGHERKIDYP